MNNLLKFGSALLCASLLVACGEDNDDRDVVQGIQNRITDNELMDNWQSECRDSDLLNLSERQFMRFDGDRLTYERQLFDDDNCEEPAVRVEYNGGFLISESDDTNPSEAMAIDLNYDEVIVTAQSEGGRDALAAVNFCGEEEWELDKEIDLTEATNEALCPLSDLPLTKYDIYHISEDQLFFGTRPGSDEPSSSQDRPSEIDRNFHFTRD